MKGSTDEALLAIATGNAHKAQEIFQLLSPLIPELKRENIVTQKQLGLPSPEEDGATFEANALLKARAVAEASGLATIGDDSGLIVDVMGEAPGIFSARWAGGHGDEAANMRLLLDQLQDLGDAHRGARFVCVAALVTPDGAERTTRGEVTGTLTRAPRGTHGFGYDPIFQPTGWNETLGQVPAERKNQISHRSRALEALAPYVREVL